ncbi:hypothetical protein CGK29_22500 [Vibrio parahaemolyticus]|nr:hypothetical protein CGK29_22500 [Vibrio parahaemolyticus]
MSNFVGCLIGFQCRLVLSVTGSMCGKGKLVEAFFFSVILKLLVSQVQKLLCRRKTVLCAR